MFGGGKRGSPAAPGTAGTYAVIRPLEVPVVTETKRLMGRGESARAVRYAYPAVFSDASRAFHWEFEASATHRELLARFAEKAPAHFVTHLARLYALYEPARYGRDAPPLLEDPVQILLSLYSFPDLWMLYAAPPARSPPNGGGGAAAPKKAARPGGLLLGE
ncbi:MAG: hypothetical protein L3J87_04435 [Thermoplasmata archaeon]|nr:hypothetical protein [Thermoplasmata archaeon]